MAKSKSTSKHQVIEEPLAARGGEIVLYQAPDGSASWTSAWKGTPSGSA
jgi:hypothetical protein